MSTRLLFLGIAMFCLTASLSAQTLYSETSLANVNRTGFGAAIGTGDGDVFVGEPQTTRFPGEPHNAPGLVFVYRSNAAGEWVEVAKLTASDSELDDGFGEALATDGQTLIVGSIKKNDGKGAVYVFEKNNDIWTQTARLAADDGQDGDGFGIALAVEGNVALVGAYAREDRTGAVYVYQKNANGEWAHATTLTASDAQPEERFGVVLTMKNNIRIGCGLAA